MHVLVCVCIWRAEARIAEDDVARKNNKNAAINKHTYVSMYMLVRSCFLCASERASEFSQSIRAHS